MKWLREGSGALLLLLALGTLFHGVIQLRAHDYVSAIVVTLIGLALLGSGVELLRPTTGE